MATPMVASLSARDLGVDLGRHPVDLLAQLGVVADQILGRQRLVGEAHVHDGGRVPLGRRSG